MIDVTNLMPWLWLVLALPAAVYAVVRRSMAAAGITVAALIAALAAFLPLAIGWQLVAFVGIALLAYLFSRAAQPSTSGPSETLFGVERVVGRDGIVIVPIDPKSAQGRVRVENEIWHADSESGEPIPDGTMVQVLSVRGDRVLVRPLPLRSTRQSRFDY
jgi:membrane protein implicated in regulation of membrane protease activity